jgi:hypothetical protein
MKEEDHLRIIDAVGRIKLKCILKKQDGKMWTGFIWHRIGTYDRPM